MIPENDNFNHVLYYSLENGWLATIVAHALLINYRYAKSENLNAGKYILADMPRFSAYVKLDPQVIICILYSMLERGIVDYQYSGIENTKLLSINEEALLSYYPEINQEGNFFEYLQNSYPDRELFFIDYLPKYKNDPEPIPFWDSDLDDWYKAKGSVETFTDATNEFINFINKNMEHPELIPMSAFAYCDSMFWMGYLEPDLLYQKKAKDLILRCVNAKGFKPANLIKLVDKLCGFDVNLNDYK